MTLVVPDACTLPTAERPLRLAEFDALFTAALRDVATISPTHARLRLTGPATLADRVRDLTDRESACCSFFTFTVDTEPSDTGDAVILDVQVPAPYADVLRSLTQRATAVAGGRTP